MQRIVYIIYSKQLNRYYIGYTSDLEIRLLFHNEGAESRKFTAKAKDWKVFFTIKCISKSQALAIEKHIKGMKSKVYIERLNFIIPSQLLESVKGFNIHIISESPKKQEASFKIDKKKKNILIYINLLSPKETRQLKKGNKTRF